MRIEGQDRRKGFTLVELLVVVGIVSVLIALLLPALTKARSEARKVYCGSNLRTLGQAMQQYAADNHNSFPRGYWFKGLNYTSNSSAASDHTFMGLRGFTCPAGTDPFNNPTNAFGDDITTPGNPAKRPADNDITGCIFLLLRNYNMPADVFICPGNPSLYPDTFGGVGSGQRSNFSSPFNLGYSISNPFIDTSNVNKGYRWGTQCNAGFALMADLNPGENSFENCAPSHSGYFSRNGPQTPTDSEALQKLSNSNNHDKKGQNCLYADGHVEWSTTAFCGYERDNIYTHAGNQALSSGTSNKWTDVSACDPFNLQTPNDSQMLPTENAMIIGRGTGVESGQGL